MGNDFNLTKSCVGVSQLCTQQINVEQLRQKSYALQHKKLRSTEEIKQKILKYIEKNRLQLYSTREKKVLQTLVSVDQQHISDKIIQMDKRLKFLQQQKRQLSRKDNKTQQENSINSTQIDIKTQKLAKTTTQLCILKQKRKKLFDQAQCLMLEDFDMILEQIPNFDQNFHSFNDAINPSQVLPQQDGKIKERENQIGITQSTNFNLSNTQKIISNNESMLKTPTIIHKENQEKKLFAKNKILHPLKSYKEKKQEEKLKEVLRIEDKKVLRKNSQIARIGAEILKDNDLLMIIPIQCFSGRGALTYNRKTGLPSNISLLHILAHKIKAVSMRRGCTLSVAFLVNQNYEKQFKDQLSKTEGFENYQCDKVEMNSNLSNLTDANSQPISYHVIPFRNIWPSFDKQNKILLNSQQKGGINFTPQDGDLIGFIEDSMQLKILIEKYQYINLTNVNNLLSQVGDAYALGYLGSNQGLDIVAKLLRPSQIQVQLKQYFHLDEKGFVSIKDKQLTENNKNQKEERLQADLKLKYAVYKKNQAFFNTEEYYIRSRIFTTESGPLKRLLMSRITRCLDTQSFDNQSLKFYLHRSPSSMLYYKFSAFLLIDQENEFSYAKNPSINHFHMNGQIGYSRYCKKLLGLKLSSQDNQQQEMVEIDAGILHKGSEEMRKILKQLRKIKEVGFPIILYSNFFNNENQT